MWICKKCGVSNSDNSNYCGNCGQSRQSRYSEESTGNKPQKKTNTKSPTTVRNILIGAVTVVVAIIILALYQSNHSHITNTPSIQTEQADTENTESINYTQVNVTEAPTTVATVAPAATSAPTDQPITIDEASEAVSIPTLEDLQAILSSTTHRTVSKTGAKLTLPSEKDMLANPFQAVITTEKPSGKSIYVMPKPAAGNGDIGTIAKGTTVWILAERSGFYFFLAPDDTMGWNGAKYFS